MTRRTTASARGRGGPRGECRRIRALLFDYCDGDVEGAVREAVDEHVVACRECGTALSKIELDRLRLREVLVPMEPSVGFTQAVMDRVRDVAAAEEARDPPSGFTRRVMDRVRAEAGAPPADPVHRKRRLVVGLACAVLVLVALSVQLQLTNDSVRPSRPDWFVASSRRSTGLAAGQTLAAPSELAWPDGSAVLDARGAAGADARYELSLDGPSRVELVARGTMRVHRGEIGLRASEVLPSDEPSFELQFPDGQRLTVGRGDVTVAVEPVVLEEMLPAGLVRVTVHVRSGGAELASSAGTRAELREGQVAVTEPLQPLHVFSIRDPDLSAGTLARGSRRGPAVAPAGERTIRGRVQDSNGGIVPGVVVRLHADTTVHAVTSGPDGSYEFVVGRNGAPLTAIHVSVDAAEHEHLAGVRFHPILPLPEAGETRYVNVELPRLQPVAGRIVDAAGRPVARARVRGLRMDSYFGEVRLLERADARTDRDGRFGLAGWADGLRGESTVLLVEAPNEPPHVVYGLEHRDLANELVVRLRPSSWVELRPENPRTRIVWVEHAPRGPLSAFWRSFERHDLAGAGATLRVRVPDGRELRWWEDAGTGQPAFGRAGTPDFGTRSGTAHPVGPVRHVEPPRKPGEHPFARWQRVSSTAIGRFAPRPGDLAGTETTAVALRLLDGIAGQPVSHAAVYVRVADGRPWFAGRSDFDGRLGLAPLPTGAELQVIAMGPQLSRLVGELRFTVRAEDKERLVTLSPAATVTGRLRDTAKLGDDPLLEVVFETGPFEGYRSAVGARDSGEFRFGDVPPGRARVRFGDRFYDLDTPSGGDVELPDSAGWQRQ